MLEFVDFIIFESILLSFSLSDGGFLSFQIFDVLS